MCNACIKLHASEIASVLGMHKWVPRAETLLKKWRHFDPAGYRAAVARHAAETPESLADMPELLQVLRRSEAETDENPVALAKRLQGDLPASLTGPQKDVLEGLIRENVYTTYGNARESPALEHINERYFPAAPDGEVHKKRIGDVGDVQVYLSGKVDGLTPDGEILEIKNRVRYPFPKVPPLYDLIQVQAYLFLLDAPVGHLVEVFQTAAGQWRSRHTRVLKTDFVECKVPDLLHFARDLLDLAGSPGLQDDLMINNYLKMDA